MAKEPPSKARPPASKRANSGPKAPAEAVVVENGDAEAPAAEEAEPSAEQVAADRDSRFSAFRESLLEHVFLAELLKEAWRRDVVVDVLRPEVDAGTDVVLVGNGVLRYVQLKTSRAEAKTSRQKIAVGLRDTPSACVIWVVADAEFGLTYRFLDVVGLDWDSLPIATRKADPESVKHERLSHRVVTRRHFKGVSDISKLFEILFP